MRARAYQVNSNAVVLEDGTKVPFDRAVVSPGVDIRYDKMPGHSQSIEKKCRIPGKLDLKQCI